MAKRSKKSKQSRKRRSASSKRTSKTLDKASLSYEALEPRQLLASADLTGGLLTITGNNSGEDVHLRVNSGFLEWSDDGGVSFTQDLNTAALGTQPHAMDPGDPLDVEFNLDAGQDNIVLDIGGEAGLRNITVNDEVGIDTVTVVSDLDLLETSGSVTVDSETVTVDNGVLVEAPEGFSVTSTEDGTVTVESNAIISTRNIAVGGNHATDPSTGDSADISLSGETITVGDDAQLLAQADNGNDAGDITIAATAAQPLIIDLSDIIFTSSLDVQNLLNPTSIATVDIGSANIQGNNVNISAEASTETEVPEAGDIWTELNIQDPALIPALFTALDYFSGEIDDFVDNTAIPFHYIKETSEATVTIGEDASIDSAASVTISATTDSEESSVVETDEQALAVTEIDATSKVTIEDGTTIRARESVDISTDTDADATSDAKTHKNLGDVESADKIAIAAAVTNTEVVSHISVGENTTIQAGTDININATATNTTDSDASGGVYKDGGAATALAFSFPNSSVVAEVDGTLISNNTDQDSADAGISVTTSLTANEDSQAITGLGGTAPDVTIDPVAQIDDFITKVIKPILDVLEAFNLINLTSFDVYRANSLAFNQSDQQAFTRIGSNADLKSNLDINVKSFLSDQSRTFSESILQQSTTDNQPTDTQTASAVVGLYNNSSMAIMEFGATADATRTILIDAETVYPFQPSIESETDSGFYEVKGNSWARSHSENGRSDSAWAVNYQDHKNHTEASIGDGAKINQEVAYAGPGQGVEVNAKTTIILLDIAGLFKINIDPDSLETFRNAVQESIFDGEGLPDVSLETLWEAIEAGWEAVNEDNEVTMGTDSSRTGVGGAFTFTNMAESTIASIGDDALVNTGNDGTLEVTANSDVKHYTFAASGVGARQVGIEGSLAHNRHVANTIAYIGSGVDIYAGNISVTSTSLLDKLNFAGGAIHGANKGFGVSFATNNLDRSTLAYIGANSGSLGNDSNIYSLNRLNVFANSEGLDMAFALSGVVQGKASVTTESPDGTDVLSGDVSNDFENKSQQGTYGIAVSADGAINVSSNRTNAFINNGGQIAARSVSLRANDATAFFAGSGTAIIAGEGTRSRGFAGSFALNEIDGSVESWINAANVTTNAMSLTANRTDDAKVFAIAAGATNAKQLGVAGSVALNQVDYSTKSNLNNVAANVLSSMGMHANDNGSVSAIAGAATWSGKSGVGSSFARNRVDFSTASTVNDSTLSLNGNVNASALHNAKYTSIAGSFGQGEKLSVAGTVALNRVEGNTEASLSDSDISQPDQVDFSANDFSKVQAFSGAVSAFGDGIGRGFAGAYSGNRIAQNVFAYSSTSVIAANEDVSFDANNELVTKGLAVGVVWEEFALALSLAINDVDANLKANVVDTTITTDGDIILDASNDTAINAYSGGFGVGLGANGIAFGAAVSINTMVPTVESQAIGSTLVSSLGNIELGARDASNIQAFSAGGAYATSFSLGGSFSKNDINSTVITSATDSSLSVLNDVRLEGIAYNSILALSGGFAGGSGNAVGAAVSLNEINSDVDVFTLNSGTGSLFGDVRVTGSNNSVIESLAVGGAGAGSFALGGSVSTNDVGTNLDVKVVDSNVGARNGVSITANNSDRIRALTGGVAGAGAAAIGAAVSLNDIDKTVNASIESSNVQSNFGPVSVTGDGTSTEQTLAVGGAGAQSFALGGSVSTNDINSETNINITDSDITARGYISVVANNDDNMAALSGGFAGATAAAIGAAISLNDINKDIDANMTRSNVTSNEREVTVQGNSKGEIQSISVGGAGAAGFALGGSVATNEIIADVDVNVTDSTVDAKTDVSVSATNEDSIKSITGGAAGAGGVAIGAAISINEMDESIRACVVNSIVTSNTESINISSENDAEIKSLAIGGAGAASFALGGAVTINRIDTAVCTCVVDGSVLTANDEVNVSSDDQSNIEAISGGLAGSGAVSVGISVVDNNVDRTVKSEVTDSTVNTNIGNASISADATRSTQRGTAIGAAGSGVVAATGSTTTNNLKQTVVAKADGTTQVNSGKHVNVSATSMETVSSNAFTGAGAGVVSGAGAIATTHVDNTNMAFVDSQTVTTAKGNVLIQSVDETTVNSVGGGGAGAGTGGIQASVSTVQVDKNIQAYIDHEAQVYSHANIEESLRVYDGDHTGGPYTLENIFGVAVQSTSNEQVNNTAIAGAGGYAFGVAGAVTVEIIHPHVEAWIGRNAIVNAGDISTRGDDPKDKPRTNVNVSAENSTTIKSTTGGLAIGIGAGTGAVDIGKVQHKVWAHIDSGAEVTAENDIDVHALSQKVINGDVVSATGGAVGLQASASVWNIGSQFDSSYSVNGFSSDVLNEAGIDISQFASDASELARDIGAVFMGETPNQSTVSDDLTSNADSRVLANVDRDAELIAGDNVDVRARERLDIDSLAGGGSLGAIAGGGSISLINVETETHASVLGNIEANDDIFVQSTLEESTDAKTLAGTGGIVSLGAAVSIVNEDSNQTAKISGGAEIRKADVVTVETRNEHNIKADSDNAGVGAIAAGISFAEVNSTGTTQAYIENAEIVRPGQDPTGPTCDRQNATTNTVNVLTYVDHDYDADATAIQAGVGTANGTFANVNASPNVFTWIGKRAEVHTRNDIVVKSDSHIVGSTKANAVAPVSGLNYGTANSNADMTPTIRTYIDDSYLCVGRNLAVESHSDVTANSDGQAMNISAATLQGVNANANSLPHVNTLIGGKATTIEVGRNAIVGSFVSQNANVDAQGISTTIAGAGFIDGTADTSGHTHSYITGTPNININNDLAIHSDVSGNSNVETSSPTLGGLNYVESNANAIASFDSLASYHSAASMDVGGEFAIESNADRDAHAIAKAFQISLAAAGKNTAISTASGQTIAHSVGNIDSTNSLNINSSESNTTTASGNSASGTLLNVSGIKSRTVANPAVYAKLGSNVNATGNIVVNANADLKTQAHGDSSAFGIVGVGTTEVQTEMTPNVAAHITRTANISTNGNVTLSASQTLGSATNASMLTGQSGNANLVGVTGLELQGNAYPNILAQVDSGANLNSANNLTLNASANNAMTAKDNSVSISGLVGVGKSVSEVNNGGNIATRVEGNIGEIHNVDLNTHANMTAVSDTKAGHGAGLWQVGGAKADATINPRLNATIATDITATGDITITSNSLADANAYANGFAAGAIVGKGDVEANSTIAPVVDSTIEGGKTVNARGGLRMEAHHNRDGSGNWITSNNAYAKAQSAAAAVGYSESNTTANATSSPTVRARVLEGSIVSAVSDMSLKAQSYSEAVTYGDGQAWGLFAGKGKVNSSANSTGTTEAAFKNIQHGNVSDGSLDIIANHRGDAHGTVRAKSGGILGSAAAGTLNTSVAPKVNAEVDATERILVADDFRLLSVVAGDVVAQSKETSGAGFYNKGDVEATGTWAPTVDSKVKHGTQITAGNDLSVRAYANHHFDGSQNNSHIISVRSESIGAALIVGREARSTINIRANVHAQVDGAVGLNAGNDLSLTARSFAEPDAYAYTKMGVIGFGKSIARATINVNMSTRAETLTSTGMTSLNAGDDVLVDSRTVLCANAYARAKRGLGANRQAHANVNTYQFDTISWLSPNTFTVAADDATLLAIKIHKAKAKAKTGFLGSTSANVNNYSIYTDAWDFGPLTAGGTLTIYANDPISAEADASLRMDGEDERLSDEEWLAAIRNDRLTSTATVYNNAEIRSGYSKDVEITARGGINVISQLEDFTAIVDAEMISPSERLVLDGEEFIKNNMHILTANPQYKTLARKLSHLCPGASYLGHVFYARGESFTIDRLDNGCDSGRTEDVGGSRKDFSTHFADVKSGNPETPKAATLKTDGSERSNLHMPNENESTSFNSLAGAMDSAIGENGDRENEFNVKEIGSATGLDDAFSAFDVELSEF